MQLETQHVPVMLKEVVDVFSKMPGGRFLDLTLGGGGHTEALLSKHPQNSVVAYDRDKAAVERSVLRLSKFGDRVTLNQAKFSEVLKLNNGDQFDGLLADLGMSTDQLKGERGFSFSDESLDMRMDCDGSLTASDIVNEYSERDLRQLLIRGGVTSHFNQLAGEIVRRRPISTARELRDLAVKVVTKRAKHGSHPATVLFQALRIEVNQELAEIDSLLDLAPKLLQSRQGVLAVITFHSLEDRLITQKMRKWSTGSTVPAKYQRGADLIKPIGSLLTKKPILPSEDEIELNPASRSARLRVFKFF